MPNPQEQPTIHVTPPLSILPWDIRAGDDGLKSHCILVAVMNGGEMESISLHVATPPKQES